MKPNSASQVPILRAAVWLLLGATLIAVFIARTRVAGLPLERDEGEYAYGGQLLLLGIAPYKLAYSMKLPGTMAAYALIMSIFGQSTTGIHLGVALTNLITVALVYFIGRQLFGELGGTVASAFYAVLSLMPYVLGTAGHATHFVVLFALAGTLVLLRSLNRTPLLFASGLLCGLGFLMKQPGFFFAVFGLGYLLVHDWRTRPGLTNTLWRGLLFITGAAIPAVVTCVLLWKGGVFEKFWFWTFQYAAQYGSQVSWAEGWQLFVGHFFGVIGTAWPIWILGLIGLVAVAIHRRLTRSRGFVITFAAASGLAVCPGLYFRPHYFILLLPALSLLSSAAIVMAADQLKVKTSAAGRLAVILVIAACVAFPLWSERDFFFELPLAEANVLINGTNPFPESIKIGDYIREQSNPEDRIAVLGSEPQIYFYSKRLSATGYIYTYGLMEPQPYAHHMQEEMIREIETNQPRFVVLVVMGRSWLAGRDSDQTIFRWAESYCATSYEEIGLINIFDRGTDYYFSARPTGVTPAADHIVIFRRKA